MCRSSLILDCHQGWKVCVRTYITLECNRAKDVRKTTDPLTAMNDFSLTKLTNSRKKFIYLLRHLALDICLSKKSRRNVRISCDSKQYICSVHAPASPLFSFPFLNPNKSNIFRVQVHASPCHCPVYVFHFRFVFLFPSSGKTFSFASSVIHEIYFRLLFSCWGDLSHFHPPRRCLDVCGDASSMLAFNGAKRVSLF